MVLKKKSPDFQSGEYFICLLWIARCSLVRRLPRADLLIKSVALHIGGRLCGIHPVEACTAEAILPVVSGKTDDAVEAQISERVSTDLAGNLGDGI